MKKMFIKTAFLTILLGLAACAQEDLIAGGDVGNQDPEGTQLGDSITLTVSMPETEDSKSRLGYDDVTMGLEWETGDQLFLVDENNEKTTLAMTSGSGKQTATFSGQLTTGAQNYHLYYYRKGHRLSVPDYNTAKIDYNDQTQIGNQNADHLNIFLFLQAAVKADGQVNYNLTRDQLKTAQLTMIPRNSIIRFDLGHITTIGQPNQLIWTVNAGSEAAKQVIFNIDYTRNSNWLTAYVSFDPTLMKLNPNGKFQVELKDTGNNSTKFEVTSTAGKNYEAGKRYEAFVEFGVDNSKMSQLIPLHYINTRSSAIYFGKRPPSNKKSPTEIISVEGTLPIVKQATYTKMLGEPSQIYIYQENASDGQGFYFAEDCSSMFEQSWHDRNNHLREIELKGCNTSRVTNMQNMFKYCRATLDVSGFNTARVTNMQGMFEECSFVNLDISSFNTSQVTDMSSMFSGCNNLSKLNLGSLNTARVTDMSSMFSGCSYLSALNLSSFNTARVIDMSNMFRTCRKLSELDIRSFNTDNVTNMSNMFSGCSGLSTIDLKPLNTANVTDMSYMFSGCSGLSTIDLKPLNTANVTDMSHMFEGCSGLSTLQVYPLKTQNATDMSSMFKGCSNLSTLDLDFFNTSKANNVAAIFLGLGENSANGIILTLGPDFAHFTRNPNVTFNSMFSNAKIAELYCTKEMMQWIFAHANENGWNKKIMQTQCFDYYSREKFPSLGVGLEDPKPFDPETDRGY